MVSQPKRYFTFAYAVIDEKCRPSPVPKSYDLIYVGRLAKSKHVEVGIYTVKKTDRRLYGLTKVKFGIVGEGRAEKS